MRERRQGARSRSESSSLAMINFPRPSPAPPSHSSIKHLLLHLQRWIATRSHPCSMIHPSPLSLRVCVALRIIIRTLRMIIRILGMPCNDNCPSKHALQKNRPHPLPSKHASCLRLGRRTFRTCSDRPSSSAHATYTHHQLWCVCVCACVCVCVWGG